MDIPQISINMDNRDSGRLFSKENADAKSNLVRAVERAKQEGEATISVLVGSETKTFTIKNETYERGKSQAGKSDQMKGGSRISIVDANGNPVRLSGRKGGKSNSFIFNEGKFTWRTRFANVFRRLGDEKNGRGASKMDILKDLANHNMRPRTSSSPSPVSNEPPGTPIDQAEIPVGSQGNDSKETVLNRLKRSGARSTHTLGTGQTPGELSGVGGAVTPEARKATEGQNEAIQAGLANLRKRPK
jgi:hypothetical protein